MAHKRFITGFAVLSFGFLFLVILAIAWPDPGQKSPGSAQSAPDSGAKALGHQMYLVSGIPSRPIELQQAVHGRIAAVTNCVELQEEFNTLMDWHDHRPLGDDRRQVDLAYAKHADDRMRSLGCYK